MKTIGEFIKYYAYITASIVLVMAVILCLSDVEALPKETLWQIILSGLLTTTVTWVSSLVECSSRAGILCSHLIRYVALCAVMIGCGKWFGWLDLDIPGIVMMLLAVATVYLLTLGVAYVTELREANRINQCLQEKYGDKQNREK